MRSMAVFAVTCCLLTSVSLGADPPAPVPPADAPARMKLPEGFSVSLFAGEPDVVQPIAFTIDDRGRLWVVENYSYPQWDPKSKDRVLILEDRDHDGKFDERKVFWDQGSNLTGIQLGFGGVWLCSTPNLVFVPDRDGNDEPDGPAEVKLDGWDRGGKHNVFNALNWGPDGWLYGCNGILSNSKVGAPGTPDERRVAINCGVWRYHPTRATFEAVAWGTTNPWGLDFDDRGQMFITNCVIHHLWHVVPGAHFQRMFGQDLNPYTYGLIQSCADHIHWAGGPWTESRGNQEKHSSSGGGHAHAGAMIYLGDNWPQDYRTRLLTCNIHGNRVNSDLLERHGSSFVAKHGPDFLSAGDPWFRGLELKYGPDGGVYLTDWCDTGECHDYDDVHRTSGRIYKITHGATKPVDADIAKLGDAELVKLQLHANDHFVRHARRVLQERAAAKKLDAATRPALVAMLREQSDSTRQLRALWALHVTGGVEQPIALELLENKDEYLRAWVIQLETEDRQITPPVADKLTALAASDPSPFVRLYLASALQRITGEARWAIAQNLAAHGEDAGDEYLPLMIWYGIEPAVAQDTVRAAQLAAKAKIPLLRQFIARRIATDLESLTTAAASVHQPAVQLDLLRGMYEALRGRRRVDPPKQWAALATRLAKSPDKDVRNTVQMLSILFGDQATIGKLRTVVEDPQVNATARQAALLALVEIKDPQLAPALLKLVADPKLRGAAIRGLAVYDDPATPEVILKHYAALTDAEKQDAVSTLSSRKKYATVLFQAMRDSKVAREDVSAFAVQQLLGLGDQEIAAELSKHWGTARATSEEKAATIADLKSKLKPETLAAGNLETGRQLFTRTCANCHTLFGTGAKTAPDLTGSQRNNLDYVLLHVVDPSAVVGRDYQMTLLETDEGRVISGIIKQEDDNTLVMQTANESVILPKKEIVDRKKLTVSMMPDGLLSKLSETEVRDLIAYLGSPRQIPLPGEKGVEGGK